MDSQNLKTYYESKKEEVGKRAEAKLNSLPVEKRKFYFKLVFMALLLFVLFKLIFALSDFDSEVAKTEKAPAEIEKSDSMDILKIDLSVPQKEVATPTEKRMKDFLKEEMKKDSLAYEK